MGDLYPEARGEEEGAGKAPREVNPLGGLKIPPRGVPMGDTATGEPMGLKGGFLWEEAKTASEDGERALMPMGDVGLCVVHTVSW